MLEKVLDKYQNKEIEIFINKHTRERIEKRIGNLELSDGIQDFKIVLQKFKDKRKINDLKFVLKMKDYFLVLNIYEFNGKLKGKILTALTEKQMHLSKNFWFYSVADYILKLKIMGLYETNVYFKKGYKDILKGIDYRKVTFKTLAKEISYEEYKNGKEKVDLKLDKYYKIESNGKVYYGH